MNDQLIWNLLFGKGWKRFFDLTMVWIATTLVASAQTVTVLYSFDLTNGALPEFVSLTQGRDGAIYGTASAGGTGYACGEWGTAFRSTQQGVVTSASFTGNQWRHSRGGLSARSQWTVLWHKFRGCFKQRSSIQLKPQDDGTDSAPLPSLALTVPNQRHLSRWGLAESISGIPLRGEPTTSERCSA